MAEPEVIESSVSVTFNPNRVDEKVLAPEKATIVLVAETWVVDDDESLAGALEMAHTCDIRIENIEGEFEEEKGLLWKLHQGLCGKIKKWSTPYKTAKGIFESKAATFRQLQKAQIAEYESTSVQSAEKEKANLLRQASKAIREGRVSDARKLREQAEQVVAIVLTDVKPEVAGVGEKEPWVPVPGPNSTMELIQAIASGKFPLKHSKPKRGGGHEEVDILEVNDVLVKYLARTQEQNFAVPGFTVKQDIKFSHKKEK
jgi:hypothetical protein